MIFVIDNYDSFTYNLVQYFGELDLISIVLRNDQISVEEVEQMNPAGVVVSPGPCSNIQTVRQAFWLDNQRMISGSQYRVVQILKQILAFVKNFGNLAVHYLASPNNFPAKRLTDALVAKAHTKNRNLPGNFLDQLY